MKILIIGGGNMGKTYADSFTANHTVAKENLYILEHEQKKVDYFKNLGYDNTFLQPSSYIQQMDLIILAIKPQDFPSIPPIIAPYMKPQQLVMSIMAGMPMATIESALSNVRVVRAMPNLPAQIGMGITGFTAAKDVTREELFMVQNLLNTTGKSLYFNREEQLDAVTAISGSGPAYVYYFMDAMISTARKMGFTDTEAEMLVEQTFMGAIHLQKMHTFTCKDWIAKVASKGGTTEAALNVFNHLGLETVIEKGLQRALERGRELGANK
jgi:pyrroline-5-carboxylate reductase